MTKFFFFENIFIFVLLSSWTNAVTGLIMLIRISHYGYVLDCNTRDSLERGCWHNSVHCY